MNMKKRNIILFIAALMMGMTAVAQDLSSQRGESQDVGVLLGEKLHHNGLVINPTPQEMVRYDTTLDISRGIALKGNAGEYAQELDFLSASRQGVALRIDKDVNLPARYGVKLVPGAYRMDITHKGIEIRAHDDLGVFYAIQSLRQIVQSEVAREGKLPCLTLNDWPSLPCRGVVEGFYGTPWSHEMRMSLITFYGRF